MWWLLMACSGSASAPAPTAEPSVAPAPAGDPELDAHMQEHFTAVNVAYESLVDGDIEASRERLLWVANHPAAEGLPEGSEARVAAMRAIAKTAAEAPMYTEMASGIGALGVQCSGCHTEAKVDVRIVVGPAPPASDELLAHMARHRWAVGAMWAGLVSASPDLWKQGAEALGGAPLPKGAFEVPGVPKESWAAAEDAHNVARGAVALTDPTQQSEAFAKVVSACARCHSEMRGE